MYFFRDVRMDVGIDRKRTLLCGSVSTHMDKNPHNAEFSWLHICGRKYFAFLSGKNAIFLATYNPQSHMQIFRIMRPKSAHIWEKSAYAKNSLHSEIKCLHLPAYAKYIPDNLWICGWNFVSYAPIFAYENVLGRMCSRICVEYAPFLWHKILIVRPPITKYSVQKRTGLISTL